MFERILVAVDGSDTAQHAFDVAVAFALERNAVLDVLFVVDETAYLQRLSMATYVPAGIVMSLDESMREVGSRVLAGCEAQAAGKGLHVHPIMEEATDEPVASVILRTVARQRSELIVLGTHGRRGLARLTIGSDAEFVVRRSTVPVLLVRNADTREVARGAGNAS